MPPAGPDASNSSLPEDSPVVVSVPPVPSTERGERCPADGRGGRINKDKALLVYPSGRSVVVRNLTLDQPLLPSSKSTLPVLVYRGHRENVTTCRLAASGAYLASGDERGNLRVWAFDHPEHLCKYETLGLTGPIRDIDWDFESKRIVFGGERSAEGSSDCAKAIQWDTGVTVGHLAQHMRGRCSTVAFKPERPMRIVTAGKDDHKTYFHKGPPFQKLPPDNGVPEESAHTKGSVFCVRFNSKGTLAVSVGTDRSICTYMGKTFQFLHKLENVHTASVYACAWAGDDKHIMTASGDGTCKLFLVESEETGVLKEVHTWKPAEFQKGSAFDKVPVGGNQVGCAFVQGDIPISVGLNGQISVLPKLGDTSGDMKILTGHSAPIAGMTVDGVNSKFYTGDTDGVICQWDLATCQPIKRLDPPEGNADLMYVTHGGAISGLSCAPGTGTLLSVGWDDKVFLTSANEGKVQLNPVALGAQPSAIASAPEVSVVCTVQGLIVLDKNGQMKSGITSTSYTAQAVAITKDGKTVYVGGDDMKVHIYSCDGASLTETGVIADGHLKPIHSLALSNDESKLASADVRDVVVFDLKDNNKVLVAKGRWCFHVQRITCLTWSPDDTVVASGGADDSIFLWAPQFKSKRIHYKYAHRGGLTGLEFVPTTDGSLKLLSAGADAVVQLWDVTKDAKEKFA